MTPAGTIPPCSAQVPFDEPTVPGASQVMVAGSYLTVTCEPTPGTTSGGPGTDSTTAVPTQDARDVTFTVTCSGDNSGRASGDRYDCSDTGTPEVLATARVRYEIDPGTANPAERAVVPKVVNWNIYR